MTSSTTLGPLLRKTSPNLVKLSIVVLLPKSRKFFKGFLLCTHSATQMLNVGVAICCVAMTVVDVISVRTARLEAMTVGVLGQAVGLVFSSVLASCAGVE